MCWNRIQWREFFTHNLHYVQMTINCLPHAVIKYTALSLKELFVNIARRFIYINPSVGYKIFKRETNHHCIFISFNGVCRWETATFALCCKVSPFLNQHLVF